MQFVFYSEKTVAQCLTAINARMQVKETASRPALDGWVEKGGAFSLSVSTPVIGRFSRRTVLKATVERESGVSVIRGSVSGGASRQGQAVVFAALALVALAIFAQGNPLFALLLIPFAAYLYIPMHGDYLNSAVLVDEVQKTLKAKSKPPRKAADSKSATGVAKRASTSTLKPATAGVAKSAAASSVAPKPARPRAPKSESDKPAAPKTLTPRVPKAASDKPAAPRVPKAAAPRKIPQGPEDEFPPMTQEQF